MIDHIVLFRLNSAVRDDEVAALFDALNAVARSIDGVVNFRLSRDAGIRESGNEDIALVARFRNEAAFNAYLSHPDHLAVLAESAPRLFAERHGIQLRV